jgi:hypothetical protein
LGWPEGTFLRAYDENQAAANELALETSCITAPLFVLLGKGPFEGTADTLLSTLTKCTDEATTKQRGWPRTGRGLREVLNRLAPNLRAVGVELRFSRLPNRKRTRMISIQFSASAPSTPSDETLIETPDGASLGLGPADLREERFKAIRDEIFDICNKAKQSGDHKAAVAGIRELIRMEELANKNRGNVEEQIASLSALHATLQPLPGSPDGRPLRDKQTLAEVENFGPAGRIAMREGFTAAVRLAELARRPPEAEGE